MFKEIRRKDRQLSKNEIKNILDKGSYGILSTFGENGYPYGVPVNYFYFENAVYFHCAQGVGHKIENINYNNKVSFTIVTKDNIDSGKFTTRYESVILFGKAYEVADNKEIYFEKLIDKFSPDFKKEGLKYIKTGADSTGLYKIEIEHITGKANK